MECEISEIAQGTVPHEIHNRVERVERVALVLRNDVK